MLKRATSILLAVVMLLSVFSCLSFVKTPVKAATTSQLNIDARANYLYNITWTCQKTVAGWCGQYYFYQGSTYRLPYGQPINSGYYIGYGVSVDTFISGAANASSSFYTYQSSYDSTYSTYYATDCSAFVSWCWGIDRKTTYSIPQVSTNLGYCTASNAYNLQLGDALNSNSVGHVVLVTGLTYDSSGNLTQIEITEQTPPQLKRSYYTPSSLGSKYGSYYTIQRYTGSVPAAPDGSTGSDVSGGTVSANSKYYPACDSSYESFYPAMESIGVTCDWTLHQEIAEFNGIADFEGTAEQNTTLLNLLKAGKLLNPDYVEPSYYPACSSSQTTFYGAMSSIGVDCDWELHQKIAAANGITNFSGTAEQNEQLLSLLKAGKLINPDGTSSGGSSSGGSSGGSSSSGTGYENGYDGGMAGTGTTLTKGLDLSSWQEDNVNFSAIKAAGYTFVILRCGTTNGKDTYFETYYSQAKAAGLNVGAYYYAYCTSVAGATADVNDCMSYIQGKKFEYPIYFDYEDSSQSGLSQSTAIAICEEFMGTLEEAGYLVGMYSMASWMEQNWITTAGLRDYYEGWVAHYAGDGTYDAGYSTYGSYYSTKYGMYQWTDKHYFTYGGVTYGPYDADLAYKDYPTIVKTYGFNGYEGTVSGGGSSGDSGDSGDTGESGGTTDTPKITLKFYANDGEGTMANQTITYGTLTAINTNQFTRTDYTFKGWRAYRESTKEWYCTDGSSIGWYTKSDIPAGYSYYIFDDGEYIAKLGMDEGDTVRMYAVWGKQSYTIKYYANGGSGTMANSTHTYGVPSCISKNTFTRSGYEFAGWYVCRPEPGTYLYGNGSDNSGYVPGNQPDGYSLILYKDQYIATTICTSKYDEVHFIAQWIPNNTSAQTYTVEYNANGAEGTMAPTEVTYGTTTKLRANAFTNDGYTFAGWHAHRRSDNKWLFTDETGDGVWLTWAEYSETPDAYAFKVYADAASVSKQSNTDRDVVTLYATWNVTKEFTFRFEANGGSGTMADQVVTYGTPTAISKNTFTREGYTFVGWTCYREATGQYRYTDGTTSGFYALGEQPAGYDFYIYADETVISKTGLGSGDTVVLGAVWKEIVHTVTFVDYDGTVLSVQEVANGGTAVLPEAPTRSGYTFIGWDVPVKDIRSDLTVTATYAKGVSVETETSRFVFTRIDAPAYNERYLIMHDQSKNIMSYSATNPDKEATSFAYKQSGDGADVFYFGENSDGSVNEDNLYLDHSNRDEGLWIAKQKTSSSYGNKNIANNEELSYIESSSAVSCYFGGEKRYHHVYLSKGIGPIYNDDGTINSVKNGAYWYSVTDNDTEGVQERFLHINPDHDLMYSTANATNVNIESLGNGEFIIFSDNGDNTYNVLTCDVSTGRWGAKTYTAANVKNNIDSLKVRLYRYSSDTVTKSIQLQGVQNFDVYEGTSEAEVLALIEENLILKDVSRKNLHVPFNTTEGKIGYSRVVFNTAFDSSDSRQNDTYTASIVFKNDTATETTIGQVTINVLEEQFISGSAVVSDKSGVVYLNAASNASVKASADTNADQRTFTVKYNTADGVVTRTVPVTLDMLKNGAGQAVNTNTPGTYTGLNLVYEGEIICTNYAVVVYTEHTVQFVDYDGTVLSTQQVAHGTSATAPSNPVRDGYTFSGWDREFTNIIADTTIRANYSKDTVYYTVKFVNYDGTVLSTQTVVEGTSAKAPSTPTRPADVNYVYSFSGWDKSFGNVSEDMVITAQYSRSNQIYYIRGTFNDWYPTQEMIKNPDGTFTAEVTLPAGTYEYKAANEDYSMEWPAGTNQSITIDRTSIVTFTLNTSENTLIANAQVLASEYTVIFRDFDGRVISTQKVTEGESAVAPEAPTRAGYSFIGWDKEFFNVVSNMTITAKYEKDSIVVNRYMVVFLDYDGKYLYSQIVAEGDNALAPDDPVRDGYTFAGWDKDFTNITADTTVTATYTRDAVSYTVVFKNWDGSILSEQKVAEGSAATAPNAPFRNADVDYIYTFAGWDKEFAEITEDTEITALFTETPQEYYIRGTFNDWSTSDVMTKTEEGIYTFVKTLESGSYEYKAANNDYSMEWPLGTNQSITLTEKSVVTFTLNTNNHTLTAKAESALTKYTVVFMDYNGKVLDTQYVNAGESATAPAEPTRDGYTFTGWSGSLDNISANTTLIAQYEVIEAPETYVVIFLDSEGKVIETQKVVYGESAEAPKAPEKSGYTFTGWDKDFTNITSDTTVTALYTRDAVSYTVVFKNWDGTVISEQTVAEDSAATAPEAPTKPADVNYVYTFAGWDKEFAEITEDTEITALFTETPQEYYIRGSFNDWSTTGVMTKTEDGIYTYEVTLSAGDYEYKAANEDYSMQWPLDTNQSITLTEKSNVTFTLNTNNNTLVAKTESALTKYTVVFMDYDARILDTQFVNAGESAAAPAEPSRDGYNFIGWSGSLNNISANTTLIAQYEAIKAPETYVVIFLDSEGKVIETQKVVYGESAEAPEAPEKSGYTFAGWDKDFTNITADTTVTATYTKDTVYYTVVFKNWDGSILSEQKVAEGSAAVAPNAPYKSADVNYVYTFSGWDKSFSSITEDTEITALFTETPQEYYIRGAFNDWSTSDVMTKTEEGIYTFVKTLESGSYEYKAANNDYSMEWPLGTNQSITLTEKSVVTFTLNTNNHTLTAKAESALTKYTVVFMDYNGKVLDTQYVNAGEKATAPAEPSRDGYTFTGWSGSFDNISANTTLIAQYEVIEAPETYVVIFLDSEGKVIETQSVAYGKSAVAPNAPEKSGYTFTGWDKDFANITENTVVTAQYKKNTTPSVTPTTTGKLQIEIAGGTSFTVSVNGGASRPQGTSYLNTKAPKNAEITVVAYASNGNKFMGWVDAAGAVVSTGETFTFTTSGNDYFKAMYQTVVEGVNIVVFKNDRASAGNGQILDMQYYAYGDDIVTPDNPSLAGYDFAGWNMTDAEIQAELQAGRDVTVLANWTRAVKLVTITVEGGTYNGAAEGKHQAYTAATVVANAPADGMKFAYWTNAQGKVVSYDSEYKFYPADDTALKANYVAESAEIEYEAIVSLGADPTTTGEKITYTLSWDVPESVGEFKLAGLMVVDAEDYNPDTFYHGSGDSKLFDRALSGSMLIPKNSYGITKSASYYGHTYYACTWVQYVDANGETVTVHSDMVEIEKLAE